MLIETENRIAKHYFWIRKEDGTIFKSLASMHVIQTVHTYIDYCQIPVTIMRMLGVRAETFIAVAGEHNQVTYHVDCDGIETIKGFIDYDEIRKVFGGRND